MNLVGLKNIMKEINEPNEFTLSPKDLKHPLYWVFSVSKVRIKKLDPSLTELRKPTAQFDTFINGLFINSNDYFVENSGNNFVISFIRNKFPELDRFGNKYEIEESDVVKIKGDLESF